MKTITIDGEEYIGAGYRFELGASRELAEKLRRRGQIVEIRPAVISGISSHGKFENKKVYELWTRSK